VRARGARGPHRGRGARARAGNGTDVVAAQRDLYLVRARRAAPRRARAPRAMCNACTPRAPQPVSYVIGPNAGGALVVGRDFWQNPARQAAAATALASGNVALSAPVVLLQNNHPGAPHALQQAL
jgi:hypothetical protein